MKGLSVRQPYANWIALDEKRIELRSRPTRYRGDLLICSCKTPDVYPAGYAVAHACLWHVMPMEPHHAEARGMSYCAYKPGLHAWYLIDIRPIRPFPVRGRQGLFEVELPPKGLEYITVKEFRELVERGEASV